MPDTPPKSLRDRLKSFALKWRNASYSALDHLWMLGLWAVSTPVFLAYLGTESFGVWTMINALVGLGGFMSFGFGESTVRFVSKYKANQDEDRIRKVVETSMVYYAAAGLFFALLIYAGAAWLPAALFELSPKLEAQSVTALKIAAGILFVTSYLKTLESTINGFQRYDVTAKMGMATRSFIILGNVVLAVAGYGIDAMLAMAAVGLCVQTVLYYAIVRLRFVSDFRLFALPDRDVSGEILRFGLQAWVQISAGALGNVVDRFLVGALISPAAAGVYAICLQLAQQIFLLVVRGLAFLTPATAELTEARPDPLAYVPLLRGGYNMTLLVVGVTAVPLMVLASQVLTFWVGEDIAAAGTDVLKLMAIYFAFQAVAMAPFMMLNGFGRPGWNSVGTMANGIATIALAAVLLPRIGLMGAVVARIIAYPTLSVIFLAFHRLVLKGRGGFITAGVLAYLTVILGTSYSLAMWSETWDQLPALRLVAMLVALSACGALVASLPVLTRRYRAGRA